MSSKDLPNVAITYGRFQGIHQGHQLVYNRILSVRNAKHYVFTSGKHDNEKNPLSPTDKLALLKKAFPAATVEIVSGGYIEAFKRVSPANKLTIVVGEDRKDVVEKLANKYNHKEYDFNKIEVIDAGSRLGTYSASRMRKYVADDDYESFAKEAASKLTDQDKKKMFELIKQGMK